MCGVSGVYLPAGEREGGKEGGGGGGGVGGMGRVTGRERPYGSDAHTHGCRQLTGECAPAASFHGPTGNAGRVSGYTHARTHSHADTHTQSDRRVTRAQTHTHTQRERERERERESPSQTSTLFAFAPISPQPWSSRKRIKKLGRFFCAVAADSSWRARASARSRGAIAD